MSRSLARKALVFGGCAWTVLLGSACWVGCSGSSSEPEGPAVRPPSQVDGGPSTPDGPSDEMEEPESSATGEPSADGPAGTGGAEGAMPGAAGASGAGASATGAGATGAGGSSPGAMPGEPCAPTLPRRLVRLTFPQIINSIETLLGPELAATLRTDHGIEPTQGTYRRLATEGHVIGNTVWSRSDAIADAAGRCVEANFEAVTGCLDELDCARNFVESFAERLFRRPASREELDNVLSVFDEAIELGVLPAPATRYGVYSALSSPLFLYRSELGESDATSDVVQLNAHELASAVSYFLTDGPPDDALSAAAASGALSSEAGLAEQVVRLLDDEPARTHLERLMFSYLDYPNLELVLVDPTVFPEWDSALRASARTEATRFLERELWSSPLEALVTSRQTFVNEKLAAVYGIAFPPSDATLDADGFASVDLPEGRAGVLTQTAFLMAKTRLDRHSVVARGLQVNARFACITINPPPDDLETLAEVEEQLSSAQTQREAAEIRAAEPSCSTCHDLIDPFGLALEHFDSLGRYREDDMGQPVDSVVVLPAPVGGGTVQNPAELGAALVQSGRFTYCVANNLAEHALSDPGAASCLAEEVSRAPSFVAAPTYSELLGLIARSRSFADRTTEEP